MLQVFANSVDITANVSKNNIRIAEQMNNRANTCSFSVEDYSVGEGAKIEVFEGFKLTAQATSGQAILNADETFQFEGKFAAGDEILLDIKGANQAFATILSVDHTAKTITLTTNLTATLAATTKCGRLVFSGVTMKNPDEEIGVSGKFTYKLTATDWTKIFDSKVVVDSYANQYSREMLGRVVYEFTADDADLDLDLFESAWTQAGTGLAMSADTSDRIQGTNSMQTGTSGSGTATWTKAITPVDISTMDRFRFWFKITAPYGSKVTSVKFRVGSDASNYYEGSSSWIGHDEEDCWNFQAFDISRATKVGTPVKTAIDWLQIEVVATAAIPSGNLHFDHAFASAGGYTVNSVIRGDRKFVDVRASYKKPTVFVDDLAKLQNFFWFIDYEKNLHFFKNDSTTAPFSLTDASMNFSDLSITADISTLKNRQTVRGGIAVDQFTYTQDEVCDGKVESWRLDYPPKDLQVWVDTTGTGSSFVQKTVGVENLTDPSTVEYLFNFNEKIIRRSTAAILPNGTLFRRVYYPYKPIRVRVQSQPSIDSMKILLGGDGIFDGSVINDSSIRDWNEARIRAKAEVDAYSNPILTADFRTQQDGLKAGQIIHITDSSRGIDNDFLIQKISKQSRDDERWTYSVDCGSSMFGIIEFFQLLLKKSDNLQIDVSEIIDIVQNDDETISITPNFTFTHKLSTFRAAANLTKWIDFISETGSFSVSPIFTPGLANVLLVAGGGGGGSGGGGGGAGGMKYQTGFGISAGANSVTIGNGGNGGTSNGNGSNGQNSVFSTLTAVGGGGGGGRENNGLAGGSGGGASISGLAKTGGSGTAGQGNNGGNNSTASVFGSGGGGGAGAVGGNGSTTAGGNGGNGLANSISGSSVTYAGGGGGATHLGGGTAGTGGTGGGGAGGATPVAGTANTGGGGGAGNSENVSGAAGGSGICIISYSTDGSDGISPSSTGGTVTTSGGRTIHTFTSSGTFTAVLTTDSNEGIAMVDNGKNTMWKLFQSGTEVPTVNFNSSSRYNEGKEMKITTTVGGSGQAATVTPTIRFPAKSGVSAAFSIWFAIDTALTGTGGFSVSVKEYAAASGGSVLATTSIVSNAKTVRDFNRTRQTFTTNASTNFVEIELKIDNAVGSVSIGEMIIEDLTAESVTNPAQASFSQAI